MDRAFFVENRKRIAKGLKLGLLVIAGYGSLQQSGDAAFAFQQEANFWWLTGIEAPGWWLILESSHTTLVAPSVEATHQLFDGGLSWEEAKRISGVEKVISQAEATELLEKLASKYKSVATLGRDPLAKYYDFALNPAPLATLRQLRKVFSKVEDCRLELARLRAIKQPSEVAAIRRAVGLTIEAFVAVRQNIAKYTYEYQVEADFSHYFRSSGAKGHAYEPIVAAGKNACTLHYVKNQDRLNKNGLLLLDIGARVGGYAADITRTYALGTATKRQQQVHAAVELAHQEIISLLKPGLPVLEYHQKVDEIMKQKLTELGLLKKPEDYRKYFPHAISHGLGIDVHDALGRPTEFKEGMVLTVEPGIYIPEEGIGVRIEDDILITKDGHENLSAALPTSL